MTSSAAYPVVKGTLVSSENYIWNTADSLGKGASAVVYLGRHKESGKYAAVKVFHDHVYQGYKTDDLRELELMRQLKHQNVIKLLAVERLVSTGKVVIVMEYCEGGSLHHMLDQPQYFYGIMEDEFLLVLYHVCSGMEYLQQKNVIHRDIKPGNIMRSVTEDGFSIYKLTDFGAARNLYENENFQSLCGTEEYLHPGMYERAVLRLPNSQSFDAKVDLWSLGVTFYHIATGQLPFQPYGGRSNRRTMFEIITQKESGVISGVQTAENGPIHWKRDLPESSPLSSGLKSVVIPVLAGLMEQDENKMITYQSLFRIVYNIKQKITISVCYYNKCEELLIYAEPNTALSGLQDLIASLTDIAASDQILIVGGKTLEEVVDPMCSLQEYPSHLRIGSIYLFQREITEVHKISTPEIPTMPEFLPTDMDTDARFAHSCSAWGELIKRNQQKISQQQERLISGLFFLRIYIESRLQATKVSYDYVKQLLAECKDYMSTFFDMVELLRDVTAFKRPSHQDVGMLSKQLGPEIKQTHDMATKRMIEIENYRDKLVKKIEELKAYASKFTAVCPQEKCGKKIEHHLSVIMGVYTRFRRDRSVKDQMTDHDKQVHGFEGYKLRERCVTMKSVTADHCLPKLEIVYRNCIQICESLTKCLARVIKVEKNIAIVEKCMNMTINRIQGLKDSGFHHGFVAGISVQAENSGVADAGASFSGAASSEMTLLSSRGRNVRGAEAASEGLTSMADQVGKLKEKLEFLTDILDQNSRLLLQSLEETSLQSSGSFQQIRALPDLDRDNT